MTQLTLEEAQAKLSAIVTALQPGEEVLITQDGQPVARLVGQQPVKQRRSPGSAKGELVIHSEDEEHLEFFRDYMP